MRTVQKLHDQDIFAFFEQFIRTYQEKYGILDQKVFDSFLIKVHNNSISLKLASWDTADKAIVFEMFYNCWEHYITYNCIKDATVRNYKKEHVFIASPTIHLIGSKYKFLTADELMMLSQNIYTLDEKKLNKRVQEMIANLSLRFREPEKSAERVWKFIRSNLLRLMKRLYQLINHKYLLEVKGKSHLLETIENFLSKEEIKLEPLIFITAANEELGDMLRIVFRSEYEIYEIFLENWATQEKIDGFAFIGRIIPGVRILIENH